jgi:hypothetical protein
MLAAQVTYNDEYIRKWDAETQRQRLTGVAANDCHHNQVFVVRRVDESTVLLGTIVDKDEDMQRFKADQPDSGILQLTKGKKAGDTLAKVDFDPYYRSFRDSATHILAKELTEPAIRAALQQGHAYVSHDWMCDPTGFSFCLDKTPSKEITPPGSRPTIMGDECKFGSDQTITAQTPASAHLRLFRDGKLVSESVADRLDYAVNSPGVYRLEAWLKLDGEERPWIYSNPIYIRP